MLASSGVVSRNENALAFDIRRPTWRPPMIGRACRRKVGLLFVITAVGVAACGTSAHAACVKLPTSLPNDRVLMTWTTLQVPVGATVYVELIETEGLDGPGLPWQKPSSSDRSVLAPVHLCNPGPSSLPLTVTAFRAVHRGKATIIATLSPRWRSLPNRPGPAMDHVTVK